MNILKLSTVVTIRIGPCLDSAGAEYTGLVIGDLTLTKNGTSAAMAAAATLTHIANGHYSLVTIAGNTDTLGSLRIDCNKATYQIPPLLGEVVPATVFDAIVTNATTAVGGLGDIQRVAGTAQTAGDIIGDTNDIQARLPTALGANGNLKADVRDWLATGVAATVAGIPRVDTAYWAANGTSWNSTGGPNVNMAAAGGDLIDGTAGPCGALGIVDQGTAQSATSTTVVLRSAASFADNSLIGFVIGVRVGFSGNWQYREITANTLADDTVTVPAWVTTPSGTIFYKIFGHVMHVPQTGDSFARIGAAGAGLTGVPWNAAWDVEVQSEVQDAIEVNHLDHLLAVDYDPASKPGVATALLNELVESDAGVSRYTANALEQAPTGGSAPTAIEVADAVLARSVSNVEATASEHSLCSVILACLESNISGSSWTIKRTNGSTTYLTKTVTSDPNADPVTGVS